jgi:predicted dehydrogenase
MNYTTQPVSFKLKKAARYIKLYGVRRTLIKIQSRYHMNRTYERLPAIRTKTGERSHVGIIGCGNFAFANIAYYLAKNYGRVIRAAMDTDINRAASLFEKYDLNYYTDDPDKLIADPAIDLVFIVSNHASHTEYAIKALELGKSVHIEKPHVVTEDQLTRLCSAISRSKGKVNLGFNRPGSRFGREIKRYLDAQSGPAMYNWSIAGHELPPDHWYLRPAEGGRVLGNLCHWTDFVYQMIPPESRYPIQIIPARADKSDRDIAVTYVFGDGSIAAITFWETKGHAFEGVKERFAAQRGNALISMDDFERLVIEVVDKKRVLSGRFREHGHEALIRRSYEMARPNRESVPGCDIWYIWGTGQLFLKTKEALEENQTITLKSGGPPPARDAAIENFHLDVNVVQV